MCENIIELAMSDDLGQMEANSKRLAIGLVFAIAPRETMTHPGLGDSEAPFATH